MLLPRGTVVAAIMAHLGSSWLHPGPMFEHLGSPKPPQISFGSPEVPRAKNWLHLASVWTASWLHGDRFSRSYSITLGCPIDVPFVVNGCPKQNSVIIFHNARSDVCCHLHFVLFSLAMTDRVSNALSLKSSFCSQKKSSLHDRF